MAAAGAPAPSRCVTVVFLLVFLGHLGQALGSQGAGTADVNPPSDEELITSLVVNQIAIIKLMRDASNTTYAAAATCAQREAVREEALRQEILETLRNEINNATQETFTRVATQQEAWQQLLTNEVTTLRKEMQQQQDRFLQDLHRLAAPACPDGWLHHGSSCYLFTDTARTWDGNLAYCRGLGGDLVKITSAWENQFIAGHWKGNTYLGLSDKITEGHFVWADGSVPTYTRWNSRQPDNHGGVQDCAYMWVHENYAWDDAACNVPLVTVCEKPQRA